LFKLSLESKEERVLNLLQDVYGILIQIIMHRISIQMNHFSVLQWHTESFTIENPNFWCSKSQYFGGIKKFFDITIVTRVFIAVEENENAVAISINSYKKQLIFGTLNMHLHLFPDSLEYSYLCRIYTLRNITNPS